MKLLDPFDIGDSELVSSNVVETVAEYDGTAYYLASDQVREEATHTLWESQTGNAPATVTISNASPGVVTHAAHGLAANDKVMFSTTGALPTGLAADTVYYVRNPSSGTYELSATSGGASINTTGAGSGVHTEHGKPNRGNPLNDGVNWVKLGPTNRWGMFDKKLSTKTTNPEMIEFTVTAAGRIGGIALFGVEGAYLELTEIDPIEGEVFDETFTLVSQDNVNDIYDYFFAPILRQPNFYFDQLPLYSGASIRVRIFNPGGTAECSNAVIGVPNDLGATEWGIELGNIDYSKATANQFGEIDDLQPGINRPTVTARAELDPALIDEVVRILNERRGKASVYQVTDRFSSALIFGFARDRRITDPNGAYSILAVDLESLS